MLSGERIYILPVAEQLRLKRADKAEQMRQHRATVARGDRATEAPRARARRKREKAVRREHIAILDMETDPFDPDTDEQIAPFLAVLYSDNFFPVVIWQELPPLPEFIRRKAKPGGQTAAWWRRQNARREKIEGERRAILDEAKRDFAKRVATAIRELPNRYTIYAHNGGRFDYMFLMPEIRGPVSFKGRALMDGKIGEHTLRDSLHILPVSLEKANKKDAINYDWMKKDKREKYKQQIVDYCISDCRYTLDVVKAFVEDNGFKMSIGQASMAKLKGCYDVKVIGPRVDEELRQFYRGGRVECLQGAGLFSGSFRLFDVNSMYPYAMANFFHPIGNAQNYYFRYATPEINHRTCFIELECANAGALLAIDEDGTLTSRVTHGVFQTTIHEYKAAVELGLISDIRLLRTIDCDYQTTFANFILPLYEQRQYWSNLLQSGAFPEDSQDYADAKRRVLFIKLYLNNAYGKFAQDPRRFKESHVTDANGEPPRDERDEQDRARDAACLRSGITHNGRGGLCVNGDFGAPNAGRDARLGWGKTPVVRTSDYWIWERPALGERGYYNVGTAASITGASRAMLMRAIAGSRNPIYCDTDSLLCEELAGVEIHPSNLGAWKCEGDVSEAYIAGKKSYAFISPDPNEKPKIRHKGGSLTLGEMKSMVMDDASITTKNRAPTLARDGTQKYIERTARRTARRRAA